MTIVTCTPKRLPEAMMDEAIVKAVETNPLNHGPVAAVRAMMPGHAIDRASLSILTARKWKTKGVKLTVAFLDGPPKDLRTRIIGHMNAWAKTANVQFTETAGKGQVRIAREGGEVGGYWSYLGTDILLIDKAKPTMNLEAFTMKTPESEFVRVVRHETRWGGWLPLTASRCQDVIAVRRSRANRSHPHGDYHHRPRFGQEHFSGSRS